MATFCMAENQHKHRTGTLMLDRIDFSMMEEELLDFVSTLSHSRSRNAIMHQIRSNLM